MIITEHGQNLWVWIIGTLLITFVMFIATAPMGLSMIILLAFPFISFGAFKKATSLFDTTDEERERMRQDALNSLLGGLDETHKVLWKLGYLQDLTDMSFQKDEWSASERAPVFKAINILTIALEKRKAQKPLRDMHPDEIRYLVDQRRRKSERDTFRMLKEEMKKRTDEIAMIQELLEAEENDNPEDDGVITEIEADIIEIKEIQKELDVIEEDIEEEKETEVDEEEDDKDFEALEREVEALDEEIEEIDEEAESIPEVIEQRGEDERITDDEAEQIQKEILEDDSKSVPYEDVREELLKGTDEEVAETILVPTFVVKDEVPPIEEEQAQSDTAEEMTDEEKAEEYRKRGIKVEYFEEEDDGTEAIEEAQSVTAEEPKKSLRDVLSAALDRMKHEDDEDEPKS